MNKTAIVVIGIVVAIIGFALLFSGIVGISG